MITGDRALASGKMGPFYYMLEEFSKHWERIDIICPHLRQPACRRGRGFGGQARSHVQKFFDNVYVHSSNLPLIFQPWFILKKGTEIFKQQHFDLFTIHSYPPSYNDIGGLWLHQKIKTPYVSEIMHITGYPKSGNLKEWLYKILTGLFIKKFTKNAKAVRIINQNQTGEFLKKHGVPTEEIKYIPAFYIDFEIFKPLSVEKKYDIVFSGRLVKNKGIFLLLEAIKKIKELQPTAGHPQSENPKIIIVGDGPLKPKIEKFIKRNNLQENIKFSGWLPTTNDVAKIYNQSKMMAISSFNEGGPRVTLEAMACKIPVLTSKVGIMLDIINNNENGIFIDWKVEDIVNKIMLLLKDDNLRNKIAENGYKTIQQFERKKVIENYALIYQGLVDSDNNS
jgi:glycosyltransferase involved in cell wall biosynthesis